MGVVKLSTAGILDYLKTSNFLSGNKPPFSSAMELLDTRVLTTSASSVTFSGLDAYSDYKHLQIRFTAREDANNNKLRMRVNGDNTPGKYRSHYIWGNGSSVTADNTSIAEIEVRDPIARGGALPTGIFSGGIVDILDFSSTTKNTTVRTLVGFAYSGGDNSISLGGGLWDDTSAVTSFLLKPHSANWVAGCRFSIYGIRGE